MTTEPTTNRPNLRAEETADGDEEPFDGDEFDELERLRGEVEQLRAAVADQRGRADRAEAALSTGQKQYDDLIESLCALIPDDEADDAAVEHVIVEWVRRLRERADKAEAERDQLMAALVRAEAKRDSWQKATNDSGNVIANLLHERGDAQDKAAAERERADKAEALIREFVAARDEYIVAIKNCPPGNSDDYWRWQGHAAARRQLGEQFDKLRAGAKEARADRPGHVGAYAKGCADERERLLDELAEVVDDGTVIPRLAVRQWIDRKRGTEEARTDG